MPRTDHGRRCALVAAVLAAAAAADELRAAVVFAGHPRTFITTQAVQSNVLAGVDALCATIKCEVFAVVAKTDGSLFPSVVLFEPQPAHLKNRFVSMHSITSWF